MPFSVRFLKELDRIRKSVTESTLCWHRSVAKAPLYRDLGANAKVLPTGLYSEGERSIDYPAKDKLYSHSTPLGPAGCLGHSGRRISVFGRT